MLDAQAVIPHDEWSSFLADLNADLKEVIEFLGGHAGGAERSPDEVGRFPADVGEQLRACG